MARRRVNISETVRDSGLVPNDPTTLTRPISRKRLAIESPFQRTAIGNSIWGIKWSCDR